MHVLNETSVLNEVSFSKTNLKFVLLDIVFNEWKAHLKSAFENGCKRVENTFFMHGKYVFHAEKARGKQVFHMWNTG